MPGPLDLLKKGFSLATTPLVSDEDTQLTMDAIDSPSLDRSPVEAGLRGFAAGAMKGFGSMSSPADILGLLAGGTGMAARGLNAAKAARGMKPMIPTPPPNPMNTAGVRDPSLMPVGEEAIYNVANDVGGGMYNHLLQKFASKAPIKP